MEENTVDTKIKEKLKKFPVKQLVTYLAITLLALSLGYIHYRYVSHLFENDRNFSHLSELEREMSFRTEMGFYYSYYKTVVEERPFIAGISKLMYDRLVEYPKDVNAFNRFNIHPEVIIGAVYRYLEPWLNTTAYRECHTVDRGHGLASVESCVGLGQPIYFYIEAIWWLAGLTVTALFLHGTALSDSILGGLLAVAQYFANHSECTRVMWAPNERENLAAPLLLLQSWLVSMQLRDRGKRTTFQLQVSVVILNCLCLLFWQFTQFIFLTQTAIFFLMEQLRIIDIKCLCVFLHSHFCGLHMAVLLLQGNDMLKSSLYASSFLVVSVYCLFFSTLRIKVQNRVDFFVEAWLVVLRVCIVVCASLYLKKVVGDFLQVDEDTHVWDILLSKFTDHKNFHTLLYTCSDVFDFLPWSSVKKLLQSFLIPFVLLNVANVANYTISKAQYLYRRETETRADNESEKDRADEESDSGIESSDAKVRRRKAIPKDLDLIDGEIKSANEVAETPRDDLCRFLSCLHVDAAIFYNVLQMAVFGVMAGLVMRLKLLFVTHMCVVSSLLMNSNYYILPKSYMKYVPFLWVISMSPVIHEMFENVSQELAHIGEFSDIAQEELLEWISRETSASGAFAGSMPILATVMLVTRRPIVAHPHYEHLEARQRAYAVYKTYGKFTPLELYQEMSKLRASYLIVENKYCYGRSSKGCSFEDIWDVEAPGLQQRPLVCRTLLSTPVDHFYPVFRNEHYTVFNIHDYSVRYMPRSFDT